MIAALGSALVLVFGFLPSAIFNGSAHPGWVAYLFYFGLPLGVALSAALNFRGCRPIVIFLAIVDCAYALAAALGVLVESVFLFWVLPGALLWLLAGFLGLSRSPNEDIHE